MGSQFSRSSWLILLGYFGFFLIMIGFICLAPLSLLLFYPQEQSQAYAFCIPGFGSISLGFFLSLLLRGKKGRFSSFQNSFLFVMVWVLGILICSIPWFLEGHYSFSQAIFEATSGLSTTGLSVVDVSQTSHLFLFYRSFLSFIGGVGLVLVLTSALANHSEFGLYLLEGHNDRLLPNIAKSSRLIFAIYLFYVVFGSVLYVLAGLPVFDAINTAMAALSTGGFSTNPLSIAGYQSVAVELVTELLMVLGSLNFVVHYFLLKGNFKKAFGHYEFGLFLALMGTVLPVLVISFSLEYGSFFLGLRYGFFEFLSALTTTGFTSLPTYKGVPSSVLMILIFLMVIGGQSGSTSGGIKQSRVAYLFYGLRDYLGTFFRPAEALSTHYFRHFGEKEVIEKENVHEAYVYAGFYLLILLLGTLGLTLQGYSFEDSLFEFSSALGTVGLSIGIVSYAAPASVLWVETIGMFLGRLEIVAVFSLFIQGIKIGRDQLYAHQKKVLR